MTAQTSTVRSKSAVEICHRSWRDISLEAAPCHSYALWCVAQHSLEQSLLPPIIPSTFRLLVMPFVMVRWLVY
jgi:hypothetical protein